MNDNTIKLELSAEEADLFMQFREHQDIFQSLIRGRIFELKACKAILNFDSAGRLKDIRTEVTTYREVKEAKKNQV